MRQTRRLRTAAAVPVLVAAILELTGTPAAASCVAPPAQSPYAFTGTVVSTRADDRIAYVVTDDWQVVEVWGTSDTASFTSVDRTCRVGSRYEFHPLNDSSPYQDNICTATHEVDLSGVGTIPEVDLGGVL
jgi:hypothetical protein